MLQSLDPEVDTCHQEQIGDCVVDGVKQGHMSEDTSREQGIEVLWRFNCLSLFDEVHEHLADEWAYNNACEHAKGNDCKDCLRAFAAFEEDCSKEED